MVREQAELKRVFIAVNIPSALGEEIYNTIWQGASQKGLRVVRPENLHLTLRFMGYLNKEVLRSVLEKLKGVEGLGEFDVVLSGAGQFNGRVLWIGVSEGRDELVRLAGRVNSLIGEGEGRFSAHLTIARNKDLSRDDFDSVLEKVRGKVAEARFRVGSVEVMESVLKQSGAEYRTLKSFDLG